MNAYQPMLVTCKPAQGGFYDCGRDG
jgi:hypothetical protein